MKTLRPLVFLCALLSLAAQQTFAGAPAYLELAAHSDILSVLAPPPLAGSQEQTADLNEVRAVSHAAPQGDLTAGEAEKKFTIFTFTPAIGGFFQPGKFPKTEAFFKRVLADTEIVVDEGKTRWTRPRPYVIDPTLANGKPEKSFSYPSGHSTESMTMALVLADLFPAQREPIIATARGIGWHRVELGRHYPTDIYAGRVLAQAIVRELKKSPAYQSDFRAAQAELASARLAVTP